MREATSASLVVKIKAEKQVRVALVDALALTWYCTAGWHDALAAVAGEAIATIRRACETFGHRS